MDACRTELTISAEQLAQWPTQVADRDGRIVGVAQISVEGQGAWLEKLFVDPDEMGRGIGKMLMDWAKDTARSKGASTIDIESDPQAEPFYLSLGARRAGTAPSHSIPGRELPLLRLGLD